MCNYIYKDLISSSVIYIQYIYFYWTLFGTNITSLWSRGVTVPQVGSVQTSVFDSQIGSFMVLVFAFVLMVVETSWNTDDLHSLLPLNTALQSSSWQTIKVTTLTCYLDLILDCGFLDYCFRFLCLPVIFDWDLDIVFWIEDYVFVDCYWCWAVLLSVCTSVHPLQTPGCHALLTLFVFLFCVTLPLTE